VLDAIAPLSPETRSMFGCLAVYVEHKIVLILREKRDVTEDNGVWLATTEEHAPRNRPLTEAIAVQDDCAFAEKNGRRKSERLDEEKIDHATGSRNRKYLESLIRIGFQSNLGMRFRPQHESSGYTKSDNQCLPKLRGCSQLKVFPRGRGKRGLMQTTGHERLVTAH
jgi:hypothetical protein